MEKRIITIGGREARYFEFEHHRYSLSAWKDDLDRNSGRPSLALTVDRHRDFVMPEPEKLLAFSGRGPSEDFPGLVERVPSWRNDDFIAFAINENLCSDVVSVSSEEYHAAEIRKMLPCNEEISDRSAGVHKIYLLRSLTGALGAAAPGGKPSSTFAECLGRLSVAKSIILDIDLDYFTYQSPDEGVFPRSTEDIEKNFDAVSDGLKNICGRVSTLCIARESVCCGGRQNAETILKVLLRCLEKHAGLKFIDNMEQN